MEKIRQAIDTRLAGQHLPETVYDALCARPARRSRVRGKSPDTAWSLSLCFVFI